MTSAEHPMTYEQFKETAQAMVEEIPGEFMEGLQGVHILEHVKREAQYEGVVRLGEYLDPGPRSFLGGNGLGRHIALYYGSFREIARGQPDFDWDAQIWETLTHELRHHVESLAGDVSLIEEDVRQAKRFKRRE